MLAEQLTQDEVQAFAAKLEAFGAQLAPKERAFLEAILQRAAMTEADDVEGQGLTRVTLAALVVALSTTLGVTGASASTAPGDPRHSGPEQIMVQRVGAEAPNLGERLTALERQPSAPQASGQHTTRTAHAATRLHRSTVRQAIPHEEPILPAPPPEEP